jgi:hypothetical protein
VDARRVERWIADLDSGNFEARREATAELEQVADQAEAALRTALTRRPTPEARRRLQQVLEGLERGSLPPGQVQHLRALAALEQIGTPEARELLEALTRGAPEARLTMEARAALARLERRPAK